MKYTQEDAQCWWLADKFEGKAPHDTLHPLIERLKSNQAGRFENMRRLIAAYERGSRSRHRDDVDDAVLTDKTLTYNHARNAIDTVHCKWIKSQTLPMAMTNGGGALERERAKMAEKALHGELRKNDWESIEEQASLDALVCSIGWAHVLHGQDSLTIDWVPAEDVLFDIQETRQKKLPRFIGRRFVMDRHKAIARWGVTDKAMYGTKANRIAKIRKAPHAKTGNAARDMTADLIEVWVAFHQRSSPDSDDGAVATIIDGCTLEFTTWDRDYLPLMPLVPFPRMRSLMGLSLMADFLPIQEEHDKLSGRIQLAHHKLGGTHLIALREAKVDTRDLDNGQGTVIEADATAGPDPIREFNPTPVNEQTYRYRSGLIEELYQSKGIPSMTATGRVPEGMAGASGKALQVQEEAVGERLLIPFRAQKRFMIGISWRVFEEARAMVEDDPTYSVRYKGERRALEKIQWKKALIDREEFDLDIVAVNALSKSAAAKFAQLTEMLKAGAIQVEQFRRLFGLPDLEAENEVDLADVEIIDKVMDQIVIEGKALQPEPFDYVALIVQRGRKFYNLCRKKEVPEERLALLRSYLMRAKELEDEQAAKAAALQQAPQAPMGQPMPGGPMAALQPPGAPPPAGPPMM